MEHKHRPYLAPSAMHSNKVEIRNAAVTDGVAGQVGLSGCDDAQLNNDLSSSWSYGNKRRGLQTL